MVKQISGKVIDKCFQQYYTKSNSIVSYMVKQLNLNDYDTVLEPCAGDGVFIDEILQLKYELDITLIELDDKASLGLKKKYKNNSFITLFENNFFYTEEYINKKFNKIIANPPYGAWVEYEERDRLKRKFPSISTKDTYALFLYHAIHLLNPGGTLVFIIPETFLYLHRHTKLREFILKDTTIKEISIFPSSFFPNVNFGYSKLCIITLEKRKMLEKEVSKFSFLDNLNSAEDLLKSKRDKYFNQRDILSNKDFAFYFTENKILQNFINNPEITLGDLASCVTGIYTGNNKKYFLVKSHELKNSKSNKIVNMEEVDNTYSSLNGISNKKCYLPVARGAGQNRFFKEVHWYIDWSEEAVNHYQNDKKARFQNSKFYFKTGLAIPMVKTKKSTAFLLENKVFEQSIVGVFPHNDKYLFYLLALFNSDIAAKIISIINPTANNSANYLKKFPVILPSEEELKNINSIIKNILEEQVYSEEDLNSINIIISNIYERIQI